MFYQGTILSEQVIPADAIIDAGLRRCPEDKRIPDLARMTGTPAIFSP
jgi:hypothetical protein